ncbi:MAG: ABC transporter ATP-binding protein [Planctomycetes bacterium]|nr:ABC transporter ATP-binding protein [Planctomycetota bacterium]
MQPVLQVTDFELARVDGWRVAVPRLELTGGGVVALFGPSGCGKTSVLTALFGLLPHSKCRGSVALFGQDLAARNPAARRQMLRHDVAWVMQDAHGALDPFVAIGRQVVQATGRSPAEIVAELQRLGIGDAAELIRRRPHEISGGQAQRVLLAVAFLRRPRLVVADEPSASLDGGNFAELVERLRELQQRHQTAVLMATHDHRLLTALQARVLGFAEGRFVPASPQPAPWPLRKQGHGVGSQEVLAARGVHVRLGDRPVLSGVDVGIRRGEIVALVGESGAGKSTLARVLAGHLLPTGGEVIRPSRKNAVQLLFQDAPGTLTPGRAIGSLLAEAQAPFFQPLATARQIGIEPALLARTGDGLSGGERRRAALLRVLAVQPDVLVLDEPTASLDRQSAVQVMQVLLEQQAHRGLALLVITHDEDLARTIAHRVLRLQDGRIVA